MFSVAAATAMPPRLSPLRDAWHHVGFKTDKTWKQEVKFINAVKGKMMSHAYKMMKIMIT